MWRIRDKLFDFKVKCQRFKRGYADVDVWCIDAWFLNNIVPMLKQLKETRHGYPVSNGIQADDEWDKILSDMIYYFTEANEYTCSQKNEYIDTFSITHKKVDGRYEMTVDSRENYEKYADREMEIDEYRYKMQQKGLKLFVKYFNNLWD